MTHGCDYSAIAMGIPKSGVPKPSVLTLVGSSAIFPLSPNILMPLGVIILPSYLGSVYAAKYPRPQPVI
jgi:hypothetical protein